MVCEQCGGWKLSKTWRGGGVCNPCNLDNMEYTRMEREQEWFLNLDSLVERNLLLRERKAVLEGERTLKAIAYYLKHGALPLPPPELKPVWSLPRS